MTPWKEFRKRVDVIRQEINKDCGIPRLLSEPLWCRSQPGILEMIICDSFSEDLSTDYIEYEENVLEYKKLLKLRLAARLRDMKDKISVAIDILDPHNLTDL